MNGNKPFPGHNIPPAPIPHPNSEQSKLEPRLLVEFDRKTRWVKVGVWRFSADVLAAVVAGPLGESDDPTCCTLVLKNHFQIRVDCPADLFYAQFSEAFYS